MLDVVHDQEQLLVGEETREPFDQRPLPIFTNSKGSRNSRRNKAGISHGRERDEEDAI
jgi:hypothetical protein